MRYPAAYRQLSLVRGAMKRPPRAVSWRQRCSVPVDKPMDSVSWSGRGSKSVALATAAFATPFVLVLLLLACASPAPAQIQVICRSSVTGLCYPCPGALACVDEKACTVIECGDILLFPGDASAADSGSTLDALPSKDVQDVAEIIDDIGQSPGDAGPLDSESDDLGPLDAGWPDASPVDLPAACNNGEKRCQGNDIQTCAGNAWQSSSSCPAGKICMDPGVCSCPDPCVALGLQQCVPGVKAIKTCQLEGNGCLSWGMAIACKPGEVCQQDQCLAVCTPPCAAGQMCQAGVCVAVPCNPACPANQTCSNGQCIPSTSGILTTCQAIVACAEGCADKPCAQACKAAGTVAAQATLQAMLDCETNKCGNLCGNTATAACNNCLAGYCSQQMAACGM